jgi:acetate kinase
MFALPRAFFERGVKRYGFHGLSYEYIASALPAVDARAASGRTIVVPSRQRRQPVRARGRHERRHDDELHRARRRADGHALRRARPGVLLYLCSTSAWMPARSPTCSIAIRPARRLRARARTCATCSRAPPSRRREAVELFCRRIAREIGSLAAALGGLDALVFTAGIGEHAAPVRARVAELCRWLGVQIDPDQEPITTRPRCTQRQPGLGAHVPHQRRADDRPPTAHIDAAG